LTHFQHRTVLTIDAKAQADTIQASLVAKAAKLADLQAQMTALQDAKSVDESALMAVQRKGIVDGHVGDDALQLEPPFKNASKLAARRC
jgi:myo-inositol catabolism protein IolC